MRFERASGVLLHPTSLPGPWGIGDLGPAAHRYLDWLSEAAVGWWQVLPLNPIGPGESPYAATSTFAGNPLLISPDLLLEEGLLRPADVAQRPRFSDTAVDYEAVSVHKQGLLRRAFAAAREGLERELVPFRAAEPWLADYALFAAIFHARRDPWWEWPAPLRSRDATALAEWGERHASEVAFEEFSQLVFFRQWERLRDHAIRRGVRILGDLPIYMAHNSAEVWANQELFQLDREGRPLAVAGVPPDYFSSTGQLWGNPLYDWKAIERSGWRWWIERIRHSFRLFDALRLDHFRAFAGYWAVPAGERSAVNGRWVDGPGRPLFDALAATLGELRLVAEDLGMITADVLELRDALEMPGMAVLHFAFSPEPRSAFLPYNLQPELVVYTGTHDNNTTVGWYTDDASEEERDFVRRYLATDGREVHWDLIRAALASVADLAVIPHQDIVGLGSDYRMNTPSKESGNWRFRIADWMLSDWHKARLAELVWVYGRGAEPPARERGGAGEPLL